MLTNYNWRPIVYTSLMLASKVWEDATVLNADYAVEVPNYSLYALMKLESAFLGICRFDMYVTDQIYEKYFLAINKHTKSKPNNPQPNPSNNLNIAIT